MGQPLIHWNLLPFKMFSAYSKPFESDRLVTRLLNSEDIVALCTLFEDSVYTQFLPFDPQLTPQQKAAYFITRQLTRYHEGSYGLHALIDKKSGAFVGTCGLLKHHLQGIDELEIGYHLFKDQQGKGYASEAVKLFMEYGFTQTTHDSIIAIIDPNNHPSIKVVLRHQFNEEKPIKIDGSNLMMYRRHRITNPL